MIPPFPDTNTTRTAEAPALADTEALLGESEAAAL
jgi:hypothetical protein